MSEVNNQLEEMIQYRDNQKKLLDRRQAVQRLMKNRDFKRIISEEFMITEAARYAHASGNPKIDAEGRAEALAIAQAGGHLQRFLDAVLQQGVQAERELPAIDEGIEEYRANPDDEE